jgi:hypothetical protein
VVKRLDQWTKQCSSKEQVARGVYPANGDQDGSLMKGRIQAGEKSPFCHRLGSLFNSPSWYLRSDLSIRTPYPHRTR